MKKNETGATIVWSKSNAGELFPFVATPMTFSVSKKFICSLLSPFTSNFGIDIANSTPFGLVAGRVYVNMNFAAAIIRKVSFSMKSNFAELFGGEGEDLGRALDILKRANGSGVEFSRLKFFSGMPYMAFRFAAGILSAKRFEPDSGLCRTLEKYYAEDLKKYPDAELLSSVDGLSSLVESAFGKVWPGVLGAMIASSLIFAAFGSERANVLLARGSGPMDSAGSGIALLKLAAGAENLGLSEKILSCADFAAAVSALETGEPGRVFLRNFSRFMLDHGHHALGEVDVACPRWREEPDRIFSIVKSYLGSGGAEASLAELARLRAKNNAEARRIISKLKFRPLARAFDRIASFAAKGLSFRENYKNRLVMIIDLIRKVLLEAGARLHSAGVIESPGDVFFISLEELSALMAGGFRAKDNIRPKINIRKKEYSDFEKVEPPSFVIGDFDMETALRSVKSPSSSAAAPKSAPQGSVFKGIPVSSGVVTGKARVIRSARTAEAVGHGEILVAPFTDPGWTPYFVNAAGLVTALGGPLSHGSIIAREYGIPAVVNVKDITDLIKTGQTITVDGNKGAVSVI